MWQTGSGGSIPSMAGFVFGVLGIFRLVRAALSPAGDADETTKALAWAAAHHLRRQSKFDLHAIHSHGRVAVSGIFIWAVVYFAEFVRPVEAKNSSSKAARALTKCGLCLAAACLTRYDGWFLAAVLVVSAAVVIRAQPRNAAAHSQEFASASRADSLCFAGRRRRPSCGWPTTRSSIAIRWSSPTVLTLRRRLNKSTATINPARGNLVAAGLYFLKAAELNVAASRMGRTPLAGPGIDRTLPRPSPAADVSPCCCGSPLLFYALSVAYGSVPIFVPTWWPFSQLQRSLRIATASRICCVRAAGNFLYCESAIDSQPEGLRPLAARRSR